MSKDKFPKSKFDEIFISGAISIVVVIIAYFIIWPIFKLLWTIFVAIPAEIFFNVDVSLIERSITISNHQGATFDIWSLIFFLISVFCGIVVFITMIKRK